MSPKCTEFQKKKKECEGTKRAKPRAVLSEHGWRVSHCACRVGGGSSCRKRSCGAGGGRQHWRLWWSVLLELLGRRHCCGTTTHKGQPGGGNGGCRRRWRRRSSRGAGRRCGRSRGCQRNHGGHRDPRRDPVHEWPLRRSPECRTLQRHDLTRRGGCPPRRKSLLQGATGTRDCLPRGGC